MTNKVASKLHKTSYLRLKFAETKSELDFRSRGILLLMANSFSINIFKYNSSLKINVLANFVGSFWAGLMGVIFIPIYIHYIGIEGFGLIGIFASLYSIVLLLDIGICPTLTRELSRLLALPDKSQEMRDLARTLEIVYWISAATACTCALLASPLITFYWIKPGNLSSAAILQSFALMSVGLAFQFLINFYTAGLLGLQRLVFSNTLNIIFATLRGAGAIFILAYVSSSIQAFFIWQAVISVAHSAAAVWGFWRFMPKTGQVSSFQKKSVKKIWKFAAGIGGISVLSLLLTQIDKIILSRVLPLEAFGYYAFAYTFATSISRIIHPLYSAFYPRFCSLVENDDQPLLRQMYHRSCQLMSVLILPVALTMTFFSKEILLFWTQNETTAENTYLLVSLLAVGTALNGLMHLPYALQLAHGWTRLSFYVILGSLLLLIPLLLITTPQYGGVGAAIGWIAVNVIFVLVTIQVMHHRILKREQWKWYFQDNALPLFAAFCVVVLARLAIENSSLTSSEAIIIIGLTLSAAFLAAVLAASQIRTWVWSKLAKNA